MVELDFLNEPQTTERTAQEARAGRAVARKTPCCHATKTVALPDNSGCRRSDCMPAAGRVGTEAGRIWIPNQLPDLLSQVAIPKFQYSSHPIHKGLGAEQSVRLALFWPATVEN